MKSQLRVLGLMLAVVVLMGGTAFAEAKIGFINVSQVFDSYDKTKQFDADLQKESEEKRVQREALVNVIKKLRDEVELMAPEAREEKQRQMDQKVQELQAFDRDARLALRKKRDDMIRDILKEIDDVIQAYGKEKGYDYIYNDRVLVYKKDQSDLSKEITARLNGKK
ncbi:MAG: OmpH family outer membrane protein [Candidatus Omnitrophica bacterium]|jgi:outer membrane protein|nr:OmpH family outer membrane protein [Candidatus Omnitrophota bacterium]